MGKDKNMTHYVKIPKDLSLIKQKFILGLTKRQAICFGIGAAMGGAAFFICNSIIGFQAACFALCICAGPALFCGMFSKNGMPFEQYLKLMITFLRKPKARTYQSENTFSIVERQLEYTRLKNMLSENDKNTNARK